MTTEQHRDPEKERLLAIEAKEIEAKNRLEEFLNDPVVSERLRAIEKRYIGEFTNADTDEKRRNVWAKTNALADLVSDLKAVVDAGKLAQHKRDIREAAEARSQRTTRR